jgi:parallel beta-helix repeat protein
VRASEAVISGGFVVNGVSNVTIAGFSVTGTNVPGSRGVLVGNTTPTPGPLVLHNNIIENWTTGISLAGGATYPWVSNVIATDNLIRNNIAGIGSTENVAGLTLSGNTFQGNAEGIGLGPGLTGLTLTGNTFTSTNTVHIAAYGAGLMPDSTAIFATNTFGTAVSVSMATGTGGVTQAIYSTIGAAIGAAAVGATVQIGIGTYAENVTINKRIALVGAGSGNDPAANTIITAAAPGTSTIVYLAGGSDAMSRQLLKNVRVTGATGGTGNNNSGILLSGGSMGYFTFENVTATGNSGHGLVSNVAPETNTLTDVIIIGSTFSNNRSAGVRTASNSVNGYIDSNS